MNTLYYGDNLPILHDYLAPESVDLIYLDPPFNSNRNYSVIYGDESGYESQAQLTAFYDTWHWDKNALATYNDIALCAAPHVSDMIQALYRFLGPNQMMAYLVMMTARLIELRRVLKKTGSLYLHCDPTASHYLKIVLDTVFGKDRFLNEIVWKRTTAHNDPKRFGRIGDRLLYYSKSKNKLFRQIKGKYSDEQLSRYKYEDEKGRYRAENLTAPGASRNRVFEWRGTHPGEKRHWSYALDELERLYATGRILLKQDGTPRKDGLKVYLDEAAGPPLQDIWTDIYMAPTSAERLGYPTQKPLALLERILEASSNKGDVILDPFCGCGTAIAAAQKLGRNWIGIDITHLAVALQKYRLKDMFKLEPGKDYHIVGEPTDLAAARQLAQDNRYQFQWWALSLVKARPVGQTDEDPSTSSGRKTGKKGADKGIDGLINFLDETDAAKIKRLIVQVKSGKTGVADIRDLRGVIERERAAIGLLITLEEPTAPMKQEAAIAGNYYSPGWQKNFPVIQILTIEQLLAGQTIQMPPDFATFKKAPSESLKTKNEQLEIIANK